MRELLDKIRKSFSYLSALFFTLPSHAWIRGVQVKEAGTYDTITLGTFVQIWVMDA